MTSSAILGGYGEILKPLVNYCNYEQVCISIQAF